MLHFCRFASPPTPRSNVALLGDETEGDMTRADLISILMNTELEEHRNLTREQARVIVDEIFEAIAEALRNGEVAHLPFGSFGVYEQSRKPIRRWILKRNRVLYKERNVIKFKGGEYDLEPADQPPHTLDSKGEMKPSERNSAPPKISPAERRKLVAIGIKARKSQRLIAHELNVTPTTIQRDLEVLGITTNKKPTATIRKPAVVFKASKPATPDTKPHLPAPRIVVPRPLTLKPKPPAPRNMDLYPRLVMPRPLKPRPPKQPSPEIPPSPEQLLRRQRLEEMLELVGAWLLERKPDYVRAINVLDIARKSLATHRDVPVRGLPESTMSAAQLRDHTRPLDPDIPQSPFRREEACATWLANWLAAWEPKDKKLRNQVIDQTRALVTA
jgi:nucleoid DNA-binding protein